jgi:hypothetical protein
MIALAKAILCFCPPGKYTYGLHHRIYNVTASSITRLINAESIETRHA